MQRPVRACRTIACPGTTATPEGYCDPCRAAYFAQADAARGTTTQRGYGFTWQRRRERILHRDPFCCICRTRPSTEVDHVRPKAAGGSDHAHNLQGLCRYCHAKKTAAERRSA